MFFFGGGALSYAVWIHLEDFFCLNGKYGLLGRTILFDVRCLWSKLLATNVLGVFSLKLPREIHGNT